MSAAVITAGILAELAVIVWLAMLLARERAWNRLTARPEPAAPKPPPPAALPETTGPTTAALHLWLAATDGAPVQWQALPDPEPVPVWAVAAARAVVA